MLITIIFLTKDDMSVCLRCVDCWLGC